MTRLVLPPILALSLLLPASTQAACHRSKDCWSRVSKQRHAHFWPHRFQSQSPAWRAWAHRVSWCESNDHRVARQSGYYSFFQWTLGTWHVAGGSGNPETHSYAEQAVKAIRYAKRYGTGAWPVCSR